MRIINTQNYIVQKYGLDVSSGKNPVEIPDTDRESLAQLFAELKFINGAEIGVERGIYSEILCKNNPKLQLYCVDSWAAYSEYRDHVRQSTMDTIYQEAKDRLAPYPVKLLRGYSADIALTFPDGSLDFVYIDANHELFHVVQDITVWQKKVRVGGIIAGHDYILRKGTGYIMHVPHAVHAYTGAYDISPWFVLGRKNTQKEGEKRDSVRSWFWVKPDPAPIKPGDGRD